MAYTRPVDFERKIAAAIVCPRRKRTETRSPLHEQDVEGPVVVTRALLESYFDMPLSTVSKELGICPTAIKRACRKVGILKWPFKTPNPGPKKKSVQLPSTEPTMLQTMTHNQSDLQHDANLATASPSIPNSLGQSNERLCMSMTFEDICNQVQFACFDGITSNSWNFNKISREEDVLPSIQPSEQNVFVAWTDLDEENEFNDRNNMLAF
eukprot:748820-Hanusia_phi.AAC.6